MIKRIYIEESVKNGPVALSAMRRSSDVDIVFIPDAKELFQKYRDESQAHLHSKEELILYKHRGKFLSVCPGSGGVVCCNYYVLHTGFNCVYNCHYCFLQSFLNNPLMSHSANIDDLFLELDESIQGKTREFRVGTGEYTDSLALEPITGFAALLIEKFSALKNATLELKTKSDEVASLLNTEHKGRTLISWSLNPPSVIADVEEGSASLSRRLEAASRVIDAGYRVAFHFDPLIYFTGWEKEYDDLIDELFDRIPVQKIAWVSLGSFRYSAGLKEMIQAGFPSDSLTSKEMIQGNDGKYRYFKTIREEIYQRVKERLERADSDLLVYLCMETGPMWQRLFGYTPKSAKLLDQKFKERWKQMDEKKY